MNIIINYCGHSLVLTKNNNCFYWYLEPKSHLTRFLESIKYVVLNNISRKIIDRKYFMFYDLDLNNLSKKMTFKNYHTSILKMKVINVCGS